MASFLDDKKLMRDNIFIDDTNPNLSEEEFAFHVPSVSWTGLHNESAADEDTSVFSFTSCRLPLLPCWWPLKESGNRWASWH